MGSGRRTRAAGPRQNPRICLALPALTCGLLLLLAYLGPTVLRAQQASAAGSRSLQLLSDLDSAEEPGEPQGSIAAVRSDVSPDLARSSTTGKNAEMRAAARVPQLQANSLPAIAPAVSSMAASHLVLPASFLHPDLRCGVYANAFKRPGPAPSVVAECVRLAKMLDSADLRSAALNTWQKLLVMNPDMERAHLRVAQLMLESGNPLQAEIVARKGLQVLPRSAALYLIAAQAAQRQGKEYETRKLLVEGLSATGSEELLSRLATVQDAHGDGAAAAYRRLAEMPQLPPDTRFSALKRGFETALRDGDLEQARRLGDLLQAAGHPEFQPILRATSHPASESLIPGGRDALAFIAMSKTSISSQSFLAEFSRALLANLCTGLCFGADQYKKMVESYFATIAQFESLGTRDHRRVSISIALGNRADERRTAMVLSLLGVELHNQNGMIRLEQGVKQQQAKKQDMVAALGIDIIGMQKALQAGKRYVLEIEDEPVEIYPDAEVWKDLFPGPSGSGFAQMLLHHPQIARLYVSISGIDRHTLDALFGAVSLSELSTRYSDELARFGPALAVSGDRAVVPGGLRAARVWESLTGASPDQAGPFFRALLTNPQLFAFFYAVSELDARHQAFFTASPERALTFYTLSKGLIQAHEYHKDLSSDSSFARFMRAVPLDENGHVIFPGSPAVWLVAKGNNTKNDHMSMLQKMASETAVPAMEDEILSHLAETAYDVHGIRSSELDNFLAVSRLNAHFEEPMSQESALLLAQHYVDDWPLYAYFSDLPGVNNIGLRNFFAIVDEVKHKPKLEQNLEMGQLYSLLAWVSILGRSEVLPPKKMADLFSRAGQDMQTAIRQGQTSAAALNVARSIVAACGSSTDENLDQAVRECMLRGWGQADGRRAEDYERVLELQKAPRLTDLDSIAGAAQSILSTPETLERSQSDSAKAALRADAQRISAAASHLPAVEIPHIRRIPPREREEIQSYHPGAIQNCAAQMKEIAAKPSPDFGAVRRLARELLNTIRPQVTAALAAPIYAYYLRSTDLVVSEDPLLLRKHRYVDFITPLGGNELVERPEFLPSSEGVGSHFEGGFATFALIAGRAAAAGFHQGGHGAEAMIAAQIAAIRSAPWDRLSEQDQRLVALRILAAREWIVRSGSDPQYFHALGSATLGILSLGRRADLLNGIENRDWNAIWNSVPLPDLFTLGSEFSRQSLPYPDSPVFAQLHALDSSANVRDIDYLGHIPGVSQGCGHLHMSVDAPYEEYARRLMEEDLAERTADFKLFLAYRAHNAGVEPSRLGPVAEQLAAKALAASQLTDYHDWRSLFAAYSSITINDLEKSLEP